MDKTSKTVAVGLSGGVDSSVAAYLLKKEGYNVIGITMKIWDGSIEIDESSRHACYGPGEEDDIEAAHKICRELDIPFHVFELAGEYKDSVLEYFRNEYLNGRTPNPCVRCNKEMKFGFMLDKAREQGINFDYFATGHYARVDRDSEGKFILKKAVDNLKDQTYFLSGLERNILEQLLFPLGGYNKPEIRNIAREMGFGVADKKESQDFIAGGDYAPLFSENDYKAGDIVDIDGKVLGNHNGIINYTIGQRRGLGISSCDPLYVLKIDAKGNKIIVGGKDLLYSKGLLAKNINLISIDSIDKPLNVKAKIRQMHNEADAVLKMAEGKVEIKFNEPQLSVTPGQSVVFYDGDVVIGSGIIDEAIN